MKSSFCSSTTVTENHLRKIRGTVSYSLRFYIFPMGSAFSALGLQLMPVFWEVLEPLGGRPSWRKFPSREDGPWVSTFRPSLLYDPPWFGQVVSSSCFHSHELLLIPSFLTIKQQTMWIPLPLSSFLPGILRHNNKVTDTAAETKQSKYRTLV